jgi:hypothetical protein
MKVRLPGRPLERLMTHSVETLTRLACIAALVGLVVMVASILVPNPLLVIFAMSGGHVIGGFAVLCYLLAVVMDAKRSRRSLPPPQSSADSARG